MATVETWTVDDVGGDFNSLTDAVASKVTGRDLVAEDVIVVLELYNNRIEDVTIGTGATTDATRFIVISGGAWNGGVYRDDGYKHRGRIFGAKGVTYGTLTVAGATPYVKFYDVVAGLSKAVGFSSGGGTSPRTTFVRCIGVGKATSTSFVGGFFTNTASGQTTYHDCIAVDGAIGFFNNRSADTLANCLVARNKTSGVQRGPDTGGGVTCLNVASLLNGEDYTLGDGGAGALVRTTSASTDGTGTTNYTGVDEADWARSITRLASILAAGTMDHEPGKAPGKIARAALVTPSGFTMLGVLGGDAAIAGGLLTGTTGALSFAAAPLTSLDSMVLACKATLPASAISRGLMTVKRASGNINRATLSVGSTGLLIFQVWDNTGSQVPVGSVLSYTPGAGELDGTHVFAGRIHGGSLYLYLDGVEVASQVYEGTRDANDTVALWVGSTSTIYLGTGASLSSWGCLTGASVPPSFPLPFYTDGVGMLEEYAPTEFTTPILLERGTLAGAPSHDVLGRPITIKAGVGAHSGQRNLAGMAF